MCERVNDPRRSVGSRVPSPDFRAPTPEFESRVPSPESTAFARTNRARFGEASPELVACNVARQVEAGESRNSVTEAPLIVIKIGGSVLTGAPAYRRAAQFISDRLREQPDSRLVVVVSAEQGATDALLSTAREFAMQPDRETLDLLWSTGELRSVALLVLALQALGLRATALNVHQTGLIHDPSSDPQCGTALRSLRLRSLLATNDVIVAPGFLARGAGDRIVSLGRGGSDLSAVLLAAGLRASRCELIKDVPGYFAADPGRNPTAAHMSHIDFEMALAMADDGCELVQREALVTARERAMVIVVRSIGDGRFTIVQSGTRDSGLRTRKTPLPNSEPGAAGPEFRSQLPLPTPKVHGSTPGVKVASTSTPSILGVGNWEVSV
jgi:aspartate kinase